VAAISVYVGYHYLKIYFATRQNKHHFFFAVAALLSAAYAFQSACLYNAASVYQGAIWQRAEIATFFLFGVFLMWFVFHYTGCLPRKWTIINTIYMLFAITIQVVDHSPRTWIMDTQSIKLIDLFNLKITYFEATSGWLTNLTTIFAMFVAFFIFIGVIRFYQIGEKRKSMTMFITFGLMFLGALNDAAIVIGVYKSIYLLEYACLGVILVISNSLSTGFIESLVMKDELEIKNRELTRIKEDLERIVVERTNHIAEQKQYFETLVESAPIAIVTLDLQHRILSFNPAFEKMFGYSRDEAVGKNIDELITTEYTRPHANSISARVLEGESVHIIANRKRKDNVSLDVDIHGVPVISNGINVGILGIYNDITELKQVESALRKSETRYRSLFQDSPISLIEEDYSEIKKLFDDLKTRGINDIHTHFRNSKNDLLEYISKIRIIDANQTALNLFGMKKKEHITPKYRLKMKRIIPEAYCSVLISLFEGATQFTSEITDNTLSGEVFHALFHVAIAPGYENNWGKVLISIEDVTEQREIESKLQYISTHDPLTDLPNRILFFDRLSHALTLSRRSQKKLAILFLDLDGFKDINDTYGHQVGDLLLQTISLRLKGIFSRESDTIARFGGDEFVVMLENSKDINSVFDLGKNALDTIAMPIKIENIEMQVFASIGVSIFPDDGETVDILIEKADKAMYHAKKNTTEIKIINYSQISE
jgi:diguanylate cyclase (GGDEF)-like protein/PAS domain S-box-containing protein